MYLKSLVVLLIAFTLMQSVNGEDEIKMLGRLRERRGVTTNNVCHGMTIGFGDGDGCADKCGKYCGREDCRPKCNGPWCECESK